MQGGGAQVRLYNICKECSNCAARGAHAVESQTRRRSVTVHGTMTTATLVPLPHNTSQWRIEKLPLAEIKQRLQAAGLQAVGTKRTLSTRLCQHLRTLPPSAQPQPGATEESSDQSEGATSATDAGDSEAVDTDQAAASGGHDTPPGRVQRGDRRRRRPRSPQSLSARDMRAVKDLLRRHSRRRPPTARSSRSSSSSSSASASTLTGSSTTDSRRSRSRSPTRRRIHRRTRGRTRGTKSRSRSRGRARHRHGHGSQRRRGHRRSRDRRATKIGVLPPIPDKLKGRITRGEYCDLSLLLHANLTPASGRRRSGAEPDTGTASRLRSPSITDFASWLEAWSVYATVLCSYYPHLAPRLFLYQHFLTLKSRSFQTTAWLRYDTEFRLKLAANDSWHFEEVDTELWASCFAADGLASAPVQSPPLACYACGSTTHLYAACPQRRMTGTRQPAGLAKPAQSRPLASSSRELPVAPTGEQQDPCFIFNDKGRCFRGSHCPYAHTCTHCGGQHSRRGCPGLRTQ